MLLAAVFILGLFTPSSKNFRRLLQSWKLLYHFSAKKPVVVVLLLLKNVSQFCNSVGQQIVCFKLCPGPIPCTWPYSRLWWSSGRMNILQCRTWIPVHLLELPPLLDHFSKSALSQIISNTSYVVSFNFSSELFHVKSKLTFVFS